MQALRSAFILATIALALAAIPASAAGLAVESYTAPEAGLLVNSHLVLGAREAVLVDAQFTRSEAGKLADKVRASGRTLKTIFITHAHPDHHLGLEVLTQAFPGARVVALPAVIADIEATAPAKIAYWKTVYKDDLAERFVKPEPVTAEDLRLDGEDMEIIGLDHGESEHAAALYVPSLRTLIAGDLVYGDVHLWLAEGRPEGWLRNLTAVGGREIQRVLSGHGPSGDAALLDRNRAYIEAFVRATTDGATPEAAAAAMKTRYSGYALPIILEISTGAAMRK